MPTIRINTLQDPDLAVFTSLTEAQLRNRLDPEKGIFIAESPKVIHVALDAGYEPLALLCEERHITGDAARIIERANALPMWADSPEGIPVYTGSREMLAELTGYTLTRGVLCAMRRPMPRAISEVTEGARRIVVIDGVVDTTNIGAIFRSAAALNMDAVLLTPASADPLYRRSARVSMGTVFQIPWTYIESVDKLLDYGFQTAAMALCDDSIPLGDERLRRIDKLAVVLGTEGDGLAASTIAHCDYTVRIPMGHGVDSLNVAAAGAVAFWELSK